MYNILDDKKVQEIVGETLKAGEMQIPCLPELMQNSNFQKKILTCKWEDILLLVLIIHEFWF